MSWVSISMDMGFVRVHTDYINQDLISSEVVEAHTYFATGMPAEVAAIGGMRINR